MTVFLFLVFVRCLGQPHLASYCRLSRPTPVSSPPLTRPTSLANHHQEPIAITFRCAVGLPMVPSLTAFAFNRRSPVRFQFYLPNNPLPVSNPFISSVTRAPSWEIIPIVLFAQNTVVPPNTIIRYYNTYAHSYSHASACTPLIQCASATNNRDAMAPVVSCEVCDHLPYIIKPLLQSEL